MARNGSGVYSLPAGSTVANGDTSDATDLNTPLADLEQDANTPRPVVAGGTGASSAADARTNLGVPGLASNNTLSGTNNFTGTLQIGGTAVTATAAELNALDGITATVAELNILDGVTSSAAELNLVDGLSSRQTTITDSDTSFPTSGAVVDYVAPRGAKAWVEFDGSGPTIASDFNVSGVSRNATGDFTITFDNAFANTDYAVLITASAVGTSNAVEYTSKVVAKTTTTVRIVTLAGGTVTNFNSISVVVFA